MRSTLLLTLTLTGCWQLNPTRFEVDDIPYDPIVGEIDGYSIRAIEVPLTCPDGSPGQIYALSPEQPDGKYKYAILFHPGAYDYIIQPDADSFTTGKGYRPSSRLTSDWAARMVFTSLGMFSSTDPKINSNGAITTALAEAGYVVLIPANCWGDMWHNKSGIASNDYSLDGFNRDGRTIAEWTYDLVVDYEQTSGALHISLPAMPYDERPLMFGLGSGGRAAAELINTYRAPEALMVDSMPDDIFAISDKAKYTNGLHHLAPESIDDLSSGTLSQAPFLPPRTVAVYSTQDSRYSFETIRPFLSSIAALEEGLTIEVDADTHIYSMQDSDTARTAIHWMITGEDWETPEPVEEPNEYANCIGSEETDISYDKIIDTRVIRSYDVMGYLTTIESDLNANGAYDTIEYFDTDGNAIGLLSDINDDGVWDTEVINTYKDGRLDVVSTDNGANGTIDSECYYTYIFDDISRVIIENNWCDTNLDGKSDSTGRVTFIYDYADDEIPIKLGQLAVAKFIDIDADGAVEEVETTIYDQGDARYEIAFWVGYDVDADGIYDLSYSYLYEDGLLTKQLHDSNGDGESNWRSSYTYDKFGTLKTSLDDYEADGIWDAEWTYDYDDLIRPVFETRDDGRDQVIDDAMTTVWDCE